MFVGCTREPVTVVCEGQVIFPATVFYERVKEMLKIAGRVLL
jgi:predicted ATP-grasp superfamily ATP-dependent carboligase